MGGGCAIQFIWTGA